MPNPSKAGPATVSVIIPTLNEEKTIRSALEALSRQTVLPLEIIVVDNGSTDATKEVVEEFGRRVPTPRILCIVETKRGPSAARNAGIRMAQGAVLAFLDADSVPGEDWVERLIASLELSFSGVGGPCLGFLPGHFMERYFTAVQKAAARARKLSQGEDLRMNFLLGGNSAFRKEALLEAGSFDETLQISEDMELCQRLLSIGKRLYFDPALAVNHASDRSTLSRLKRNYLAGMVQAKVLKHHFPKGMTLCFGGLFHPRRFLRNAGFAAVLDLFSVTKVGIFLMLAGRGISIAGLFLWGVLVGWRICTVYHRAKMRYSFVEFVCVLFLWFLERICLDLGRWHGSFRNRVFYL